MQEATIREEVESRLGDLFDRKGASPSAPGGTAEFPLKELKATVLSVDWEINDQTMDRLLDQVERLRGAYEQDRVVFTFLRLLGSVGQYVKSNKANAHPDAVKLLNSIYLKLERVMLSHDMTQESKKRTLLAEVEKFKSLQGKIAQQKTLGGGDRGASGRSAPGTVEGLAAERKPHISAGQGPERPTEKSMIVDEPLARVLDEIKKTLRAEFAALKAEIRAWREGR